MTVDIKAYKEVIAENELLRRENLELFRENTRLKIEVVHFIFSICLMIVSLLDIGCLSVFHPNRTIALFA